MGSRRWERIRLWEDKCLDNEFLRQQFPRLFSVSLDVGRTLSHVGEWSDNCWLWKLGWRKVLYVGI